MKRLTLLALAVGSLVAFAQDGGAQFVAGATAPVPPPDEFAQTIAQLFAAAGSGQIALAVAVGLMLLTRLVLKFGSRIPGKVGEWLLTPTATWVLPMALSILGAVVTTLAVPGAQFSIPVLLSAVLIGLAGGGQGASAAAEAKIKADAAANSQKITTPEMAVAVINKGPNP